MPERSNRRRYVPPAGRSTHAQTMVRERGAGRSTRGHADKERGKEEVLPPAGRSTHAQMTARSEAWAGALATPAGGGRGLEKVGERERGTVSPVGEAIGDTSLSTASPFKQT